MQLITTHRQFFNCLDYVTSVIPAARIDPILSHVLMRTKENEIMLVGTDHQVQMTASCEGKVEQEQECILPADKLRRVLSTFESDTIIKMDFNGDEVTISADSTTFKLMKQNTERFTLLGETSKMEELETLSCEELLDAINRVQHSAAHESHRQNLNGVLFQCNEMEINFVATDGHRMTVKTVAKACKSVTDHIIPIKTVQILAKNLGNEGKVAISANDRTIRFSTDKFELISNIIQEAYPDYTHVIPHNNEHQAIAELAGLKKCLERVIALSDNAPASNPSAYMEFDKNKLSISCNNSNNDSLVELLDIKYSSEKIALLINAPYLLRFLGACKEQMVEINMSRPESSVLIRPIEEEQSINYVIMPVRT